jgi:nucleoside-triphosphatase THEP1
MPTETKPTLTTIAALASKFINQTNRHVFLTGKAGTGKTTFLRYIIDHTHKKAVVVAPTGIAAINAGGVTIHSLFQLPFGTFLPQNIYLNESLMESRINTPESFIKNLKMQDRKRRLLREIELLIIDEVSMLRADLLDALDTVLQHIRRKRIPFGGVQILFIGDMLQLSPVVKDNEWDLLKSYYDSIYFFDALALKGNPPVYLELDKIYRQSDQEFINILNNLRNNTVTKEDIEVLNTYYDPDFQPISNQNIITLTTHNNRADTINLQSLEELKGKVYQYEAVIEGEFPAYNYPVENCISLKKNAQIMFIKNDTAEEKRFFNGKLATIINLSEDEIEAEFEGGKETIKIEKHKWENIRYVLNDVTNEIEEEILGSYTQYPIKLAWAITIHKSQGLTFEKAVIDIGRAFAPGQVYVALSRLKSLKGLVLMSAIQESAITIDEKITAFGEQQTSPDFLEKMVQDESLRYLEEYILMSFDFSTLLYLIKQHAEDYAKDEQVNDAIFESFTHALRNQIFELSQHANKFIRQLYKLFGEKEGHYLAAIVGRVKAAKEYFLPLLQHHSNLVLAQVADNKNSKKKKTYCRDLQLIDAAIYKQMELIKKAEAILISFLDNKEFTKLDADKALNHLQRTEQINTTIGNIKVTIHSAKNAGKDETKKEKKPVTKKVSLDLYQAGKSMEEISKERGLTLTTIEGHLAHFVGTGDIDVLLFIAEDRLKAASTVVDQNQRLSLSELLPLLPKGYTYWELKMAIAYLKFKESVKH